MIMGAHPARGERIGSAIAVAAIHALLGYAFIAGLGQQFVTRASDTLKIFDVRPPPPPPPEAPVPADAAEAAGKAAPANLKSKPSPIVRPPPKIRIETPPPIAAAPAAGTGSADRSGASPHAGTGTGAGGTGIGTGSGGEGNGPGSGIAIRARQIAGGIEDRDYPRAARRARIEGTVYVRFTVETDGRAHGCTVIRSSGAADLDGTTCQLIEQRYRYRPALDAKGRPVPEDRIWKQIWWIEGDRD
jgi:protein TonB